MDYAQAVAYLTGREPLGIKFGLENIRGLAEALGHPERSFRSLLIAGTNGKGSTAAILESILRAAGHRTGRYTSPHLVRIEERMTARGSAITPKELASVVAEVKAISIRLRKEEKLLTEPTFFEVTTACAFEFFRRRGVEVAVLEVGMGGRWDATNIVPASLTAITNIGFDHERFLGWSLAAIAAEKAATIKTGRPVVTGFVEPEPRAVIRAEAARLGSPLFETPKEVRVRAKEKEGGQQVCLETPEAWYEEIFLPLPGAHQLENLAVAVRAAELVRRVGVGVSEQAVISGVVSTVWEARLETVPGDSGEPDLLIDAGHNPLAARALSRYLEAHPSRQRVLLFGIMKDKRAEEVLRHLLPHVRATVVTRPPIWRAKDPEPMARWAASKGFRVEVVEPTGRALVRARRLAGESGQVLVAGSIFLAGEVKRLLREESRLANGVFSAPSGKGPGSSA
ncbi:MAG: bifunctional folylpolyglutamate synthase/dihydrofolate synthase [Acidobacteriota bacterium]